MSAVERASGAERCGEADAPPTALMARSPLPAARGGMSLLPAARGAGKALGFLRGAEQRLRLVDAFLLLEVRI